MFKLYSKDVVVVPTLLTLEDTQLLLTLDPNLMLILILIIKYQLKMIQNLPKKHLFLMRKHLSSMKNLQ